MSEPREDAYLQALEEVGARAAAAGRLEPPGFEAVLRSVVETAVALFDAEAVSIALHDPGADRLVIRVAAGPQGEGAIGIAFAAATGIAGYVVTTGQALAVADVESDPRFDRSTAERTGYVPRSILAVPVIDDAGVMGVLEVLDRRGDASLGLRDLDLAALFARQAAIAVRATRAERGAADLLSGALSRLAAGSGADPEALEAAVAEVARGLDGEDGDRLWALADAVARARRASPEQVGLVIEILDALARRTTRPAPRAFRR